MTLSMVPIIFFVLTTHVGNRLFSCNIRISETSYGTGDCFWSAPSNSPI